MSRIVRVAGASSSAMAGLTETFHAAGFAIETGQGMPHPTVLTTLTQSADAAIQAATAFAHTIQPDADGTRMVVNIWHVPAPRDWETCQRAATMTAFTRHAALAWAAHPLRVNAITLAGAGEDFAGIPAAEIAATILALWRWPSMTGQIIHLAA